MQTYGILYEKYHEEINKVRDIDSAEYDAE